MVENFGFNIRIFYYLYELDNIILFFMFILVLFILFIGVIGIFFN
ncbi:hypothetical protein [Escherichia coli]